MIIATLLIALTCIQFGAVPPKAIHLRLNSPEGSIAIASREARILEARIAAIGGKATFHVSPRCITVNMKRATSIKLEALLTMRGVAELRVGSQVYNTHPAGRPFASARAVEWMGRPRIELTATNPGQFYKFTQRNLGRNLDIVIDGRIMMAPNIQAPIRSGAVVPMRSLAEAKLAAALLNSGPLVVPAKLVARCSGDALLR